MLLTGVALLIIFLTIEWRYAKLPILPISLFRYGRSANILVFINILIGWIYWGNLFVLPLYLQSVRGASPSEAGLLLLPMVMAHGITSALSGILISMSGHYKPIIVTGAFCWVIAAIAKLFYDQGTAIWKIAIVGIFDGVGVGCSLQPGKHLLLIASS
jgi:cyanate permease